MMANCRSLVLVSACLVVAAALAVDASATTAHGTATGHHLLGVQGSYNKHYGYGHKKSYYGGGYGYGHGKKYHGRKLSGLATAAESSDPLTADVGVEGRALLDARGYGGGYKKGGGYYKKGYSGGGYYKKGYGHGRKLNDVASAESVAPVSAQLSDPLAVDVGVEGRALLSTQATQGYKGGYKKGGGYYKTGYTGGGYYKKGYGHGRKLNDVASAESVAPISAQLSDPLAVDVGVEGRALLSTQATQGYKGGYKKGGGYYKKGYSGGGYYKKGYGHGRKLQ